MDASRGLSFLACTGRQSLRVLRPLALTAWLSIAGCTSAPTLGSPVMPTTRAQKPDDPVPSKPAIELTAYSPSPGMPARQTAARICATVNGVAILDDELREAAYPQMLYCMSLREPERSKMRKEFLAKALEQVIEREVILQEAFERLKDQPRAIKSLKDFATKEFEREMGQLRSRLGIKNDDDFRLMLASQGISLAGVQRQKERNVMALEFMKNLIIPKLDNIGRDDMETYYKHHPEEFRVQDSVAWQDIFIDASKFPNRADAQQFAETLRTRARNGEDFARLVKEFDQGDSSWRNGEGFGKRRGEIKPPEMEPVLFQMTAGDISPVIALNSGFHLAKLTSRDYAGPKPFDEKTQQEIRNKLKGDTWELEYKRAIADLKLKTTIEVSASLNP
jgi:parvulin-like peptidyl-prolyl isomerase